MTAEPWEERLEQAILVVGTAISIAADHGSRSVQLSARSTARNMIAPKPNQDPGTVVAQKIRGSCPAPKPQAVAFGDGGKISSAVSRGQDGVLPAQLLQIPPLLMHGPMNYPAPPSRPQDGSYAVWYGTMWRSCDADVAYCKSVDVYCTADTRSQPFSTDLVVRTGCHQLLPYRWWLGQCKLAHSALRHGTRQSIQQNAADRGAPSRGI